MLLRKAIYTVNIRCALLSVLNVCACFGYQGEPKTKDIVIFEGSNFAEIVKTTLFVDKTLLIKRFFDKTKHGSGIIILTPSLYGKSTNMDMIRRFCEINVDDKGEKMGVESTFNYQLFRNNYLNIYRLTPFFNKHFGKYPVISIDYGALSQVTVVEQMLAVFYREIVMSAFLKHQYLLNDTLLWGLNETFSWIDKEKFECYSSLEKSYTLKESDLRNGLRFLAQILHTRYEERVVVLIDNYDAFVESPLFRQNKDVFRLVGDANCELLRSPAVERCLVVGKIRASGQPVPASFTLPSSVSDSDAEKLWPYYGLSGVELDQLLQPIMKSDEHRREAIGRIVHEYSGYSVASLEASKGLLDVQACSVWSLIKYMEREMAVENFSSLV